MKLKEIKAKMPINKLWMQKSRVSQEYDDDKFYTNDDIHIEHNGGCVSEHVMCVC